MELLITTPFITALIVQIALGRYAKKTAIRVIPFALNLLVFLCGIGLYNGILTWPVENPALENSGMAYGLVIFIVAASMFIGIIIGWVITLVFYRRRKER